MENFIVLGIIPGTDYQTTFSFWLGVAGGFVGMVILAKLWRKRHAIQNALAARQIARVISQYQVQA